MKTTMVRNLLKGVAVGLSAFAFLVAGAFLEKRASDELVFKLDKTDWECFVMFVPNDKKLPNQCVVYGAKGLNLSGVPSTRRGDNDFKQGQPVRPKEPTMRGILAN